MSDASAGLPPRKRLRVGIVSERSAINAVKTLLERHKLVVQEYDTRNDYGKDLVIDLTENDEITGAMVAAQVKGGKSFFRDGKAFIPARAADVRLWADSTVPVVGIVWDPRTEALFWVNLTERCRAIQSDADLWPPEGEFHEEIPAISQLDDLTLPNFVASMHALSQSASASAFLALVDNDDANRRDGVFTCWTLGRADARALILLRQVLPKMEGSSFIDGVRVLTIIASNPDVYHHVGNWIPTNVVREAALNLDWSAEEIEAMYYQHELMDEEGDGWQRGGSGQALWHVLNPLGRAPKPPFEEALGIAVAKGHIESAFRLLIAAQWQANDPRRAIQAALSTHPELREHWMLNELIAHVDEWGACSPY